MHKSMIFNPDLWAKSIYSWSKILEQLKKELNQSKNKYKDEFRQLSVQTLLKKKIRQEFVWRISPHTLSVHLVLSDNIIITALCSFP